MNIAFVIQNPWVQAALALLPALIVTLIIFFARKMFKKISYILLTLSVLTAFVLCTVSGLMQVLPQITNEDERESSVSVPEKDEYENAVYAFIRSNDPESASRLVSEYADNYGYDKTCSLLSARIALSRGNYEASLGIYRKLYGSDLPEEAKAVEKIVAYKRSDSTLSSELAASGKDPTISESEIAEAKVLLEGGINALLERVLAGEKAGNRLLDGAKWVIEANELYERNAESDMRDEVSIHALFESMSELSQRKLLSKLSVFREARLKLALLRGDFDDIVDDIDGYTGYTEYMVALDLYLNGQVTKRDLMKAFDIERLEGVSDILRQLRSIKKDIGDDLDSKELDLLESQINRLDTYRSDEVLYFLENKLSEKAQDSRNSKEASKIYMSLAKLSQEGDNDISRNRYFSDALVTSPSSNDGEYSYAMNELAGAISKDNGSEGVKDIPQYAEQAIENSYILKGEGKIVRTEEKEEEQVKALQDYTVKAGAAVTINGIDTGKFNEVVVKVQISDEFLSEHELINLVRLNDCNYDITDFSIEKIDYKKANIILCCDNSGSMSGSIGSLKNAVSKFIQSSNEKESLGFYTFDDEILTSLPIGTATFESLQEAIDRMDAQGGTNIFDALTYVLGSAPYDPDANQAIILMTDGQDGKNHSEDEIVSIIGSAALNKGYIVYVLGMGSGIDTEYLTMIANATGGQFVFSPSDSELDSLYTFIHGALKNQYKITFKAQDTLTVTDRKLTVSLDERNVKDTRYYSIGEDEESGLPVGFDRDVTVYGLRTRLIYKQKNITDIDITGNGFKAGDSMSVTLWGERNYTLRATFIDENTFRISVPADIAPGCYNAEIYLGSRKAMFLNELTVAEGEPDEVIFGGYHFTAYHVEEYDTGIELSGYVTMNDWLHFSGNITLTGSLDDASITLNDYSGCYIDYTDSTAATGYAAFLKKYGIPQYLPYLGSIIIYNAASSNEEYPTEPHTLTALQLFNLCNFYYPILRLYPDRITLEIDKGDTKLPWQEYFISSTTDSASSPFSISFNCVGTLSAQNISIKGEVGASVPDGDSTALIKFLDTKASIKKTVAKFEFDTLTNEYGVEFNININKLLIDTYVGFGLEWKDMKLNAVKLHYDHDYTKMVGGVPITFSDFMLGLEGIAETLPDPTYEQVSALALTGSMQIDAAKVSAVVPKLKKYVGDASLLTIPDAQFKLRFRHFLLEASASLEMLNCFTLAKVEVKLGNFEFSNAMLGLENADVNGVYLGLTEGLEWDSHNIKVELTGKGEGTINSRFVGLTYTGKASLELNWWIFEKTAYTDGQALVGFYKDHSDNMQFTIRTSKVENGKRRGAIFYISSTGKMDYDLHYKY